MQQKYTVYRRKTIAVITLLAIWQLLSLWVNRVIFLPSVTDTLKALVALVQTKEFYLSIGTSFLRISSGFVLAVVSGVLLAVLAEQNAQLGEILQLLIQLIKSIPVASFVILVLLWVSSAQLSTFISFFMVLPVIFTNVRGGIHQTDQKLLEMAKIFDFSPFQKVRYIYLPAVRPAFVTACSIGLGFCWKSGIAAEVIGLPKHSIGSQLYQAKLYLMTPELFAWTIVIVWISILFEKIVMYIVRGSNHTLRRKYSSFDLGSCSLKSDRTCSEISQPYFPVQQKKSSVPYCIVLENLTKYYGSQLVLSNVSRSIKSGEKLCIMGASGIGKTTLLSILAGLETADSGTVSGIKNTAFSMVFQEDRLLDSEDAFTNVAAVLKPLKKQFFLWKKFSESNKRHSRKSFSFRCNSDKVSHELIVSWLCAEFKQIGLTDYKGKPVSEFSGGMKRRVAIVRAVCADTDLLLFDEPFKGLDDASRRQVIQYIKERTIGRTIIVVTHDETDAIELGAEVWTLGCTAKN